MRCAKCDEPITQFGWAINGLCPTCYAEPRDRCEHCGDYLTAERWPYINGELCQLCWEEMTAGEWWDNWNKESEANDEP